jgi:exopolysaccharide production protein ExoQ
MSDGNFLLLLASAAIALPVLAYAAAQSWVWNRPYAFWVAVAILVLQCATFRTRDISDKSIDFQILIKLGCLAAMTLHAGSALAIRRPKLLSGPLMIWTAFLAYTVLTSFYSVKPSISTVETLSVLIGFIYIYSLQNVVGREALVKILVSTCFILCIASIIAYAVYPQLGRMSDWINGAFVPTSRLSGVFGTANAAGAAAAVGIMLTVLLLGASPRRPAFYLLLAPMLFCLIASNNRMSLLALVLGLTYAWIMRGHAGPKLLGLALASGLGALVMIGAGDSILESISRSGSAEEITSWTGRTRIWSVVVDLWLQQPLLGYGDGSAKFILPVHPLLFTAAAHAHSLYLNTLFSGGLIGLSLLLAGIFTSLSHALRTGAHGLISILIFQLVYGLTEPTIGGLLSFPGLAFFTVFVLIAAPRSALIRRHSPSMMPQAASSLLPKRYDDEGGAIPQPVR